MITCPKCNKELSDDTKFCDSCGAKIYETIFCPNCGERTSTEFAFCQNCGTAIAENPAKEQPAVTTVEEQPAITTVEEQPVAATVNEQPVAAAAEEKKIPKKAIMYGGIGVAVVAVLILNYLSVFQRWKK